MAKPLHVTLTPERALIFRITHRSNLRWIFQHGLHCSRSAVQDPEFVSIGNPELIQRRRSRRVPIPPGGALDEYIPFYFTPSTPMLYNVSSGYGGIPRRSNDEIVVLVSSLLTLEDNEIPYVFSDRHAYLKSAQFFTRLEDLDQIDYELLRRKDFERDPEDPDKIERYQAEALVHKHMPVTALLGISCYSRGAKREIEATMAECPVELTTVVRAGWYFR